MTFELPKRVAENIDRFTGRAWLLPQILKWWDKSDDRLFLLTGGPGTGKSMFVAWLAGFGPLPLEADARVRLERLRGAARAAYFCRSEGLNTPRLFAESVAGQLANRVSGYQEALKTILEDRVQIVGNVQAASAAAGSTLIGVNVKLRLGTIGDEFGFDQAFVRPLRKLYENDRTEPILLLVDALDEAQTYNGVTLPDLLSRLVDLPPAVRILATTRDEPEVLKFFHAVKPFDLIKDADPDVYDVQTYAEGRLEGLSGVEEVKRKNFARRLATQADGVFLYAAMVLDEVERASAELPNLDSYPLPKGLNGLYHDFLTRGLGKTRQWTDRYRPLLGLIAVAQGEGLAASQLASIAKRRVDKVEDTLLRCKQYLTGELPDGPFRLFHKSFADFLLEHKDNPKYNIDAKTTHARIADRYWGKKTDKPDPANCDEYALAHLANHLYQAEQFHRLERLISQEWMHARVEHSGEGAQGFITDLELAWRATLRVEKDTYRAIVKSLRYALIRTSVNSISADYPPSLVARALVEGLWTSERLFGLAASLREFQAVAFWAAVLATGRLDVISRNRAERLALDGAGAIKDPALRVRAYTALAESLDGRSKLRALEESVQATNDVSNPHDYVDAVSKLAPLLAEEQATPLLLNALLMVKEVRNTMGSDDDHSWARSSAIVKLSPHLSPDLAQRALEIANELSDAGAGAAAQAVLFQRVPEQSKGAVIGKVLDVIRKYLESWRKRQDFEVDEPHDTARPPLAASRLNGNPQRSECVRLIRSMAPILSPSAKVKLLGDAVQLLPSFDNDAKYLWLFEIAPFLDKALALRAAEKARTLDDPGGRAKVFADLAPLLSSDEKQRFLTEAFAILQRASAATRLSGLVAWLPNAEGPLKDRLLGDIVTVAEELAQDTPHDIQKGAILAANISAAIPLLPRQLIERALDLVLLPGLRPFRKEALDLLAPSLSGELLQRALRVSAVIEDERPRVLALSAIGGHLAGNGKEETLQYALSSAMQIGMFYPRATALAELAYVLNGANKERALMEGLQAAQYSDMFSDLALAKLAPHLTGGFVDRGLEVARHFSDSVGVGRFMGTRCLATMASRMSGEAKDELIGEVLDALQSIDESDQRGRILLRMASSLDGKLLERAWIVARKLDAGTTKVEFLVAIARRLSGRERDLALSEGQEVAEGIAAPTARVEALVELMEELSKDGKRQAISDALTAAENIDDEGAHAKALATLAPMLSGTKRRDVLGLALELLERTEEWRQADVLRLLVPQLDGELLDRAARLAEGIADAKDRASALGFVAARLIAEAKDSGTRTSALQRVGTWMFSVREIPRPQFLFFCTESLFKSQVLSQSALTEIAQCIREISEEWHFEPTAYR